MKKEKITIEKGSFGFILQYEVINEYGKSSAQETTLYGANEEVLEKLIEYICLPTSWQTEAHLKTVREHLKKVKKLEKRMAEKEKRWVDSEKKED